MASRIMHLVVAKQLINKLSIQNEIAFYYGNLAPDLARYGQDNYEESHFGCAHNNQKGIDYIRFINKYSDVILADDFAKGYLTHLITDAIWLMHIQQVYVRKHREMKKELYKDGYQDMAIYNPFLIEKFDIKKLKDIEMTTSISEINTNDFKYLLSDLSRDFLKSTYDMNSLKVYPVEAILKFIDKSIEESVQLINDLNNNCSVMKSAEYYVPIN